MLTEFCSLCLCEVDNEGPGLAEDVCEGVGVVVVPVELCEFDDGLLLLLEQVFVPGPCVYSDCQRGCRVARHGD